MRLATVAALSFALSPAFFGSRFSVSADEAYRSGLKVWRQPGATPDRAACASCHGPDGLELASYAFDRADILRRARVHLSQADSLAVVDFIQAVRARFGLKALLDPMRDRPLQPGGAVLQGATPAARDEALGLELERRLPLLFRTRITTVAEAKTAASALLALDPWQLEFGIPLNRLSEDIAHGNEHASIAQWLPDVMPTLPEGERAEWYAAEDDYLTRPSLGALRKLIDMHARLTRSNVNGIAAIANLKYESLLMLDYRLRAGVPKPPQPSTAPEIGLPGPPNPAWELGDLARMMQSQRAAPLGFDEDLRRKKLGGPALTDQLRDLTLSWLWLGWLLDQGMYHSRAGVAAIRGDWLAQALSESGPYPIHDVYSTTRRQLVASFDRTAWMGPADRQHLQWDYAALRMDNRLAGEIPKSAGHKRLYLEFTQNCIRMNLLLLLDELTRTHRAWLRSNSIKSVQELTSYLETSDPASQKEVDRLRDQVISLINSSSEGS